jgi:DNA polymerase III epsilon subunit-like protein
VKWTDVPVHVVDFEGSVRSGVVEFGVVTLVGGEIEALHTRICAPHPHEQISPAEMRIHRLGPQNVAGAEPFTAEWTRFAGLRETGVLAAHFSATEHALLRTAWPVPRLSPDFLSPGARAAEWGPWIDTGRLAVALLPQGGNARLGPVVQALGLQGALELAADQWCPPARRQFHCAPFDALACALVLQALAKDPNGDRWTLARVLTASTANVERREERQQARWF